MLKREITAVYGDLECPVIEITGSNPKYESTVATFSSCMKYRYSLRRVWDRSKPPVNFLMLNPSTADWESNDPTVERCERRAREMGLGSMLISNCYALRSTDPRGLLVEKDPVGPVNDLFLTMNISDSHLTICGWGEHAKPDRYTRVRELLRNSGKAHFLRLNASGQPAHPLYLPYSLKPKRWANV